MAVTVTLSHTTFKIAGQKLHAVADWNANHQITADLDIGAYNFTTTGIGTFGHIEILTPAIAGRESLFHCQVSDAAEDRFAISNATGVANRFAALLLGSIESTETNIPISFIGQSDTTRDAGTIPLLSFIGRRYLDGQDWNNPAGGFKSVVTRPIIAFRNKGVVLMQVEANGRVVIGTPPPATSAWLELKSTTGALLLSRMTTAQRNALTAVNGMMIYNTTTNAFNFYENGAWVAKVNV